MSQRFRGFFALAEDPYGGLQLSINAVLGDLTSSSGLHRNQENSEYTYIQAKHPCIQNKLEINDN